MIDDKTLREQLADKTRKDFLALSEREKQVQGGLWALTFLVAELATGLLLLRQTLVTRGLLTEDDEKALGEANRDPDNLNSMYHNTEAAFLEKYQRIRFAMENPEAVQQAVEEQNKNV